MRHAIPKRKMKRPKFGARSVFPGGTGYGGIVFRPNSRVSGPNFTGLTFDEQQALCLAGAWACVRVISTDMATMPLDLVQRMPDGSYRPATEHAAYPLFRVSPDLGNTTPMRSIQAAMGHLLTYGSAFYGIDSYQDGRLALRLFDPRGVEVGYDPDKVVYYRVRGVEGTVDRSRIVHLAGLGWDGLTGYEPVSLVKQALALAQASENYAASFTTNGNKSSGLLKSAAKMEEKAVDEMLDSFEGTTAGGVGYLPPGVDFIKLTVDPQNSQLLQSRLFQLKEIARIFGCPLNRIAEIEGYSYAGMEAESFLYVNTTLRPWATCIEQGLNLRLLSLDEIRRGFEFRFDFASLLRADTAARTAFYTGLTNCGAITKNEIRVREGLPRVADPDADKLFQPLNMTPIGSANGSQD